MQRRKSRRHQIAAMARWRAARWHADYEREAGIPDRPAPTDCRDTITLDLRSYGGRLYRIEPRLGYIACRATDDSGQVECAALKTLLHRIADSLPRTMGARNGA